MGSGGMGRRADNYYSSINGKGMTQDLANKLIAHYEEVIKKIKNKRAINAIDNYLYKSNTNFGICLCAKHRFNEFIYCDKWINSFGKKMWHKAPIDCFTKSEILEALQFRVDRLKTFKESDQ